ncbi:MAG: hypothetical protein ACXVW7_15195, partial [Trebonia sp.]
RKACPGKRATPRHRKPAGIVNAESAIYRHRCNDPLSSPMFFFRDHGLRRVRRRESGVNVQGGADVA